MEIAILIFEIIIAIGIFYIGLFTKNYLPSYMNKKGENLATKEDVEEITRKTEEVQREFKEKYELFSFDVKFKYDFFNKQYSELYCKLYAIIIQSEYVRKFVKLNNGKKITFDDTPFLEISPIHRETVTIKTSRDNSPSFTNKIEDIETPISQFNKMELCDYIIEKGALASQKLLKLAVSYRFAYDHYSGNGNSGSSDAKKTADEEEFRMIKDIVMTVVRDYNQLRKELKLEYNEDEIKTGILEL